MTISLPRPSIPSEFDDEVDDAHVDLPPGHVWAYPCKLSSCPDYGTSWLLRSNFLLHLQEEDAHWAATTPAARRTIEQEWRYMTDPHLPPRKAPYFRPQDDPDEHVWEYGFRDDTGKVIKGRGTMKQMEMHQASRRREIQERQTA
ncbi:hypothetical protein J1614_005478 [Plenodomus biglobosus]|nr:hypothetical protein J1614_005478 [Plenodomus biglobosus]